MEWLTDKSGCTEQHTQGDHPVPHLCLFLLWMQECQVLKDPVLCSVVSLPSDTCAALSIL